MCDRNTADNKQLVSSFMDAMSTGELDMAFELMSDDAGWFNLSSRRFADKEKMRARIQGVMDTTLDGPIVHTVLFMTAEDDRVAVLSLATAVAQWGHATTRCITSSSK